MTEPTPTTATTGPAAGKPAILRSSEFTVEEGLAYRAFRTGAIWMNKLFFSSLVLLVVWLAVAAATGQTTCTGSYTVTDGADHPAARCSVFLTPTAKYLGAMAVLTFLLSLAFGALGLVVGKRILEVSAAADEVGAGAHSPPEGPGGTTDGPAGDVPGQRP
jgi:hypothetical protein